MMNIDEKIAMANDIMQAALQYKMHLEDGGKENEFTDALLATIALNGAALRRDIEKEIDPCDKPLKQRISEAYNIVMNTKKEKIAFENPNKDGAEI